jgi:hypothetical protein
MSFNKKYAGLPDLVRITGIPDVDIHWPFH